MKRISRDEVIADEDVLDAVAGKVALYKGGLLMKAAQDVLARREGFRTWADRCKAKDLEREAFERQLEAGLEP